jgi:hypothetical protein
MGSKLEQQGLRSGKSSHKGWRVRRHSDLMSSASCTVTRAICLLLLTSSLSCHAEAPRISSLAGITLGSSPEQVGEFLKGQRLYCEVSAYGFPDEEHTEGIETISASTVSVDGTSECRSSASKAGVATYLSVRFARRQIDSSTGAMSISHEEFFSLPSTTIGQRLSGLKGTYGEPSELLVERRPAIGPTDIVIPGLFFYEVRARWFAKSAQRGSQCTSCRFQMSARLSTHGPPDKLATDLKAAMVTVYLEDEIRSARDRTWFSRRR